MALFLSGIAPYSDTIDLTDDSAQSTITFGPMTIGPAKAKAKASPKKATATTRAGTAGKVLDKILPLKVDALGKKTIFGLPPALVYLAGGIVSAALLAYLYRLIRGGGGRRRASNPKRRRGAK